MQQQELIPVSGLRVAGDTGPVPISTFQLSSTVCIAFLIDDENLSDTLQRELATFVDHIPIVSLSVGQDKPMLVDPGNVFLITDYTLSRLKEDWLVERFAGIIVVSKAQPDLEMMDEMVYLLPGEHLAKQISIEVMSRLFPMHDESRLILESRNQQQTELLQQIARELSMFYHNINNPMAILSGNIQLMQLLAESMEMPEDFKKPISDISDFVDRFGNEMKLLAALKERIKAGDLQKGEW